MSPDQRKRLGVHLHSSRALLVSLSGANSTFIRRRSVGRGHEGGNSELKDILQHFIFISVTGLTQSL